MMRFPTIEISSIAAALSGFTCTSSTVRSACFAPGVMSTLAFQ
jgi:hypothetical protein